MIPTAITTIVPVVNLHVISTLPHTSPFLYIDSSYSDTSERPPSQEPYEVTIARWRSRVASRSSPPSSPTNMTLPIRRILHVLPSLPRRPAVFALPGQPIPIGRPYRTQPHWVHKMFDNKEENDSSLDSPSDSSLSYSSDTSLGLYIPNSPFDTLAATSAGPSRKRCRSCTTSESVGTSTARVILFGMIPTAITTIVPVVNLHVISTLPHTSLFLYIDSSYSDTSERPPSQEPYEVTIARWRSRVASRLPCRPAVLVLRGQSILIGRPYRTQPNGVRKMLTARKRVQVLPVSRLASRYPPDHSSSDHFSSEDSSSDSSSDS
nr:hypothetical protein [Tanacetum cinerariifolium]